MMTKKQGSGKSVAGSEAASLPAMESNPNGGRMEDPVMPLELRSKIACAAASFVQGTITLTSPAVACTTRY